MIISRKAIELEMARKQLNLSGIAEKTGISVKTIGNVLYRQKTQPVTLGRIAAALEVDPETLIRKEL